MTLSNRGQGFPGQYNTSSSSNSQPSTKKSSRARVIDRSNEELDNAKKQLNEALHEVMKQRTRAEYFKGQMKLTKWRKVSESSRNKLNDPPNLEGRICEYEGY